MPSLLNRSAVGEVDQDWLGLAPLTEYNFAFPSFKNQRFSQPVLHTDETQCDYFSPVYELRALNRELKMTNRNLARTSFATILAVLILLAANNTDAQETQSQTKNSIKKIRVKPSQQASRIGTAVHWEKEFGAAIAKSQQVNKPVFWYVPTLRGTFMDRKKEIDRYMMAGPFSWRPTVASINENFVPLKASPTKNQMEKYGLAPFDFIEPGFVILKPEGTLIEKVDRITTLHPKWFNEVLARSGAKPNDYETSRPQYWKDFQQRNYQAVVDNQADDAESMLFKGMALFRLGKQSEAAATWKLVSEKFPEDPLGWKAAAEAEGIGPFRRGFEVYSDLTADYSNKTAKLFGTAAAQSSFTSDQLWSRGIEYILGMQDENGGFVQCDYDYGGTDSLPNVYVAVTSLSGMSMLKAMEKGKLSKNQTVRTISAIKKAVDYVSNDDNINRFDKDEILWAYAYRLRFLVRAKQQLQVVDAPEILDQSKLTASIENAIKSLERVQGQRGGWYHEYNNPFVTATALAALKEAKNGGHQIDESKVSKGVESLAKDRMGNGSFPYDSYAKQGNKPGTEKTISASAGRMPLCEMGLWYWDRSTDADLVSAIRRSIALQDNLNIALKYDDHTSHLAYGGFFFWYDMRARSEAINLVKDKTAKTKLMKLQRDIIMGLPEIDGCFVDSHELGRVYGTAMALLSLSVCE